MIATQSKSWEQLGAYTPDQAARLLGVRPGMVQRWIYGDGLGSAALLAQFPDHVGELVTFIDFIQTMAIRDIRQQKQLSLQKIRKTVEAAKKHGIDYPFARQHTTYVFNDDVVLRLNDDRLIQVTGKYKEQDLIKPVVERYMEDLGFDDHGLASSYVPMQRGFRKVVYQPNINYGAPTIMPCRYTVSTLLDAVEAEGGIEQAANICDVNTEDVRLAVDYESKLRAAA